MYKALYLVQFVWISLVIISVLNCLDFFAFDIYRQISNIRRTLAGNKILDHSDVVGASPFGTAPTTSSFSI